jgi:hypothetical protein
MEANVKLYAPAALALVPAELENEQGLVRPVWTLGRAAYCPCQESNSRFLCRSAHAINGVYLLTLHQVLSHLHYHVAAKAI